MSVTRTGKIARLPRAVREEINRRLADGEQGKRLVAWLNALPDARAVLAAEFGGRPIREQNLSEWKRGGYRDWLAQQEAIDATRQLREEATEADTPEGAGPTETLARWLAGRYAVATRRLTETDGAEGWRMLRELCADVVELRRGDHSAQRLVLERERVAAVERDADMKWKRKIVIGLETLMKFCAQHPEARAALAELTRLVRHPFDPTESE